MKRIDTFYWHYIDKQDWVVRNGGKYTSMERKRFMFHPSNDG